MLCSSKFANLHRAGTRERSNLNTENILIDKCCAPRKQVVKSIQMNVNVIEERRQSNPEQLILRLVFFPSLEQFNL